MNNLIYLYLFHLFVIAPLFIFVGYNKKNINHYIFLSLLILGIINLIYHLYLLVDRYNKHKIISHINIMHILFVAPLLIYIGYLKNDTPTIYLDYLLILGSGLSLYFIYKLFKIYN